KLYERAHRVARTRRAGRGLTATPVSSGGCTCASAARCAAGPATAARVLARCHIVSGICRTAVGSARRCRAARVSLLGAAHRGVRRVRNGGLRRSAVYFGVVATLAARGVIIALCFT